MPSKLQHEIDKLRGRIAETGEVFKDTMADLEDQVDTVSKNILAVETDLKGSIRKTKSDAKSEASHAANSSLPSSGGSMSGEVDMQGHDITGISDFEAEDSGGIGFYNENSVLTLGIDSSGNLTPQGTVDGMDIAAYKILIDAIEAAATADQSDAEIKTAIENATDLTIGSGFRISASQINRVDGDADDISMAFNYNGYNNSTTRFRDTVIYNGKHAVVVSVDGSSKDATFNGDIITAHSVDGRDLSVDGTKLDAIEASATADQTNTEIRDAVEAATDSNTFNDADHTKLNGCDTGAKDDQTGAEIKTAYEAQANAYTDTKNTKLAGIETAATADQSNAEIKTAYETAAGIPAFIHIGAIHNDYRIYNAACPMANTNLDLSSITGANVSWVFMRVKNTSGTDNIKYTFQPGDESLGSVGAESGVGSLYEIDGGYAGYVLMITNSSGVIKWRSPSGAVTTEIHILGWIKVG